MRKSPILYSRDYIETVLLSAIDACKTEHSTCREETWIPSKLYVCASVCVRASVCMRACIHAYVRVWVRAFVSVAEPNQGSPGPRRGHQLGSTSECHSHGWNQSRCCWLSAEAPRFSASHNHLVLQSSCTLPSFPCCTWARTQTCVKQVDACKKRPFRVFLTSFIFPRTLRPVLCYVLCKESRESVMRIHTCVMRLFRNYAF